jgi:glucose-1-phosphate adenylyltransferase
LAGGKGSRLEPLTRDRAKPAVPFGGDCRIIDFTLSNCVNSGLFNVLVLTQYKALSLQRHITLGWERCFCRERGEFIDVVPPQQRIDENWYQGTADAVYQNIYVIERERPHLVLVLAGDHVYRMNYQPFLAAHVRRAADLSIGVLPVPRHEAARQFGVLQVDADQRVIGFQEKPADPKPIPGDPRNCLASMGIYVSSIEFLFETLCADATRTESRHDFGGDVIPAVMDRHRIFAYPFLDESGTQAAYWRDVGTLDAYYAANMDLVSVEPQLNMYDETWPIRTHHANLPPAKFVFAGQQRRGCALDSIVCPGAILSGGLVQRSIVGRSCRVNSYACVEDSILFDGVTVGRHSRLRRTIVEKGVCIPAGMEIGFDQEEDVRRGLIRSEGGVTVVAKGGGGQSAAEAETGRGAEWPAAHGAFLPGLQPAS